MKPIKVPTDLLSEPFNNKALCMNGLSVVDSCYYDRTTTGSMYLEEHVIFYVLKGKATLYYGKQAYTVGQDEFILLKRATMYPFIKEGVAQGCTSTFHGILFCLQDELLADFIRMARIHPKASVSYEPVTKKATGRLKAFTRSLIPYFEEEENIDNGLLRLKVMELLYDVMHTDAGVWQQIMALGCPSRKDIAKVLEDNFLNPISVPELAYLSGRSLSGFKREFQSLYHMPPPSGYENGGLNMPCICLKRPHRLWPMSVMLPVLKILPISPACSRGSSVCLRHRWNIPPTAD